MNSKKNYVKAMHYFYVQIPIFPIVLLSSGNKIFLDFVIGRQQKDIEEVGL